MVCIRCEILVRSELEKMQLPYTSVKIGEAETVNDITEQQRTQLDSALRNSGLELLDDKKNILLEKIKNGITELVNYYTEGYSKINISDYLKEKLNYDYTYLANFFSEMKGITIEQFFIKLRVGRAQELMVYNELNLTEIAEKLNYSSVSHLSKQFKKVTGLTPSHYKQLKHF